MTELPRSFEEALRVSAEVDVEDLEVETGAVGEPDPGVELPEVADAAEIVVETGAVEPAGDDDPDA